MAHLNERHITLDYLVNSFEFMLSSCINLAACATGKSLSSPLLLLLLYGDTRSRELTLIFFYRPVKFIYLCNVVPPA